MPRLQPLNIIVAGADGGRFYAALETAMAAAALGARVRLFLQGEAASLLEAPIGFSGDAALRSAGQPDLASLVSEAAAMKVELLVCQSGMARVKLTADRLIPGVKMAGPVSFLAELGEEDRLVVY